MFRPFRGPPPPGIKHLKHRLEDLFLAGLIPPVLFALSILPRPFSVMLGRIAGRFAFWCARRDRQRAISNLRLALHLPPREAYLLAHDVFATLGRHVAELAWHALRWPKHADEIDIEGMAHLHAALSHGRGVLCLSGHVGNWELMAMKLARLDAPGVVVAAPLRYPRLHRMLERFRRRHGLEIVYRGPNARAAIHQWLQRGAIVGILVDQHYSTKGLRIPFFQQPAHTPSGPFEIAALGGTPIVTGFITRAAGGRHLIRIEPLVAAWEAPLDQARLSEKLTELNRRIEKVIRRDPESWPWFHERWRT